MREGERRVEPRLERRGAGLNDAELTGRTFGEWLPITNEPEENLVVAVAWRYLDCKGNRKWQISVAYRQRDVYWQMDGISCQPTHWMPLPPPPTEEVEKPMKIKTLPPFKEGETVRFTDEAGNIQELLVRKITEIGPLESSDEAAKNNRHHTFVFEVTASWSDAVQQYMELHFVNPRGESPEQAAIRGCIEASGMGINVEQVKTVVSEEYEQP